MTSEIKLNLDGLKQLQKRLKELDNKSIDVGFFDDAIYPAGDPRGRAGLPVATVAMSHEYGLFSYNSKVLNPRRPFFSLFIRKMEKDYKDEYITMMYNFLHSDWSGKLTLLELGDTLARGLKETIEDDTTYIQNAPRTIEQKGGRDDPLVDTGFMRDSVDFKIRKLK